MSLIVASLPMGQSREKLITAVMDEVRARVQHSVIAMLQAARGEAGMESIWNWATDKRNLPYVRLLYEVQALALQNPTVYSQYLSDSSSSWIEVIGHAIPESADRHSIATLCGAVIDGLVLEYMSTGDLTRTSAALKFFVSLLENRKKKIKQ